MSSQVLITGATGFIGRRLVRDLVRAGQPVRVLVRDGAKARSLFNGDVDIVEGEVNDGDAVRRALREIDVVYHIAGIYRFGLRYRHELWRVNVEGTEQMLRGAAEAGVERMVHLSSASVLEGSHHAPLVEENHFPKKAPRFCPYKLSKWQSERLVMDWARRGLPVSIASTSCPIGEGDEAPTPTGQILRDFLQQKFPFYGHTGLNFIAVADLSRGLQRAAAAGRPGERYLLCHENLWLKEFLDMLEEETGLPAPTRCLPNWVIQMAGFGGEIFDLVNCLGLRSRVCIETAVQAKQVQFFNNSKTQADLDWTPEIPVREILREAVAWFGRTSVAELPEPAASSVGSHAR